MAFDNRNMNDRMQYWHGNVPFKVLGADRCVMTGDLLVYVEGQQLVPVRVPEHIAPYGAVVGKESIDYISAVLEKRARGNIFHPRRHDAYKGFRQHTEQRA